MRNGVCLLALAWLTGGTLSASPQGDLAIRGLVSELGTTQPVADAEISISFLGAEQPQIINPAALQKPLATAKTDVMGAFAFRLEDTGYYIVSVKKAGYNSAGPTAQTIALTTTAPSREVRLILSRPGQLTGSVVDADTGKPIQGLKVSLRSVVERLGGRALLGQAIAFTDREGEFTAEGLPPGGYVVMIGPQADTHSQALTKFSAADAQIVDVDYADTYWPGGAGADATIPVTLGWAASMDVGKLTVRKVPYYRVLVHMDAVRCEQGETASIADQRPDKSISSSWKVPCGQDALISGFSPGSHSLIVVAQRPSSGVRDTALVPLFITDKNLEVKVFLEPPIAISGVVTAVEGTKLPALSGVNIRLSSQVLMPFLGIPAPAVIPDAKGEFWINGSPPVSQEVRISGLASTHYVKEIRYNGIPIRDDVVPIEKSAAMQSLAIVLDDRPATITGSAVDGDRPVGQAYVMLQKWPPASDRTGSITSTCTADERGSFQFTGLVPGRYRIISIRSSAENLRRGPGVLERAMVGASQVDVGRGENQQITVEVRSLVAKTSDRSALPAVSWRPLLVPLPAALIGFFRNPA